MTARPTWLPLLVLGIALGIFGIVLPLELRPRAVRYIPLDVSLGWAFVFAGALAWARRPDNRTGVLMILTGLVWFGRDFFWWGNSVGDQLGNLALSLTMAVVAHQFVVFPHGESRSRLERILIGSGYLLAVAGFVLTGLFYDPQSEGCLYCDRNPLLVHGDHSAFRLSKDTITVLSVALAGAILIRLSWRVLRASRPARRSLTPLVCVAPIIAATVVATMLSNGFALDAPFSFGGDSLLEWGIFVYVGLPLAFLVGLLRTRLHRTALGSLVVELSRGPTPDEVQAALARALADPSLEVAYRAPELGRYVDAAGRPIQLPVGRDDRAVTVLEQEGEPLAALVHDPSLLEDAAFVDAAGAAARLALANARLQAELRAQLVAVRESRARIVTAGDQARRRLERDLHDGAQQRLLGIRLALQVARRSTGDTSELEQLLAEAESELEETLDELRALARGIHPAVLTEEGLTPALETLARRSSLPVAIESLPDRRLPPPVEAAAYFVASEALANVTKHAHASQVSLTVRHQHGRLVIEVADDGVGGADPRGNGLIGVRDRVEALDGSLLLDSPTGHGTRLHAEIPCA